MTCSTVHPPGTHPAVQIMTPYHSYPSFSMYISMYHTPVHTIRVPTMNSSRNPDMWSPHSLRMCCSKPSTGTGLADTDPHLARLWGLETCTNTFTSLSALPSELCAFRQYTPVWLGSEDSMMRLPSSASCSRDPAVWTGLPLQCQARVGWGLPLTLTAKCTVSPSVTCVSLGKCTITGAVMESAHDTVRVAMHACSG